MYHTIKYNNIYLDLQLISLNVPIKFTYIIKIAVHFLFWLKLYYMVIIIS